MNITENIVIYTIVHFKLVNKCILTIIKKNSKGIQRKLLKETIFGVNSTQNITELNKPAEMAREFNNFCSKIGKNISDSVHQTAKSPEEYTVYLTLTK